MKSFRILLSAVTALTAVVFVIANLLAVNTQSSDRDRFYNVEAERIVSLIRSDEFKESDIDNCFLITNVEKMTDENQNDFFDVNSDYIIKNIDGTLYRFDYKTQSPQNNNILIMNISIGIMALSAILITIFIGVKIILPFEKIKNIPYDLAKGKLTVPLKESKNRWFGNFLWGLDLLREHLEQQKAEELRLQQEKKTLILSLLHDIKTPLSAIKLYSKALERNLYSDEKKRKEIAINIDKKCTEIDTYLTDIVNASQEDFLKIEVNVSAFYLSELVEEIKKFYTDKLSTLKTEFIINCYDNCLLTGDFDRSVEVIQNIMENAIKYGDGKLIELNFRQEEDCILFCVKNSGCNLSQNELPHIFESFWRGSNTGKNSGSGLGLYICREIMHKSGGEIFAELKDSFIIITAVFRIES